MGEKPYWTAAVAPIRNKIWRPSGGLTIDMTRKGCTMKIGRKI